MSPGDKRRFAAYVVELERAREAGDDKRAKALLAMVRAYDPSFEAEPVKEERPAAPAAEKRGPGRPRKNPEPVAESE